jgi:hypothetical protein
MIRLESEYIANRNTLKSNTLRAEGAVWHITCEESETQIDTIKQ